MLAHAGPSEAVVVVHGVGVMEKREQKMHSLVREGLQNDLRLEMHRAANAEAHLEAEFFRSIAKDYAIHRLERKLRNAKKS